MLKAKYALTLALIALCVVLASGMSYAQDAWAVDSQDLPTALEPGELYDASVVAENTGSTSWTTAYELWSMAGPTTAAILTDRWGLDLVPVTAPTDPGGTVIFDFEIEAPPWLTLAYSPTATPTTIALSQPVPASFDCGWMMSDGATEFGPGKATEDVVVLPAGFTDVPTTNWAFGAITEATVAVSGGDPEGDFIVQGITIDTYSPTLAVDREGMAVFIARAAGYTTGAPASPTFPDVPATNWAYREIEQCVDAGVVQGYEDGLYHPTNVVTRDQMAVYIARAAGFPTAPYTIDFPDVAASYWAAIQIQSCVNAGVVQGYEDGLYHPTNVVTRDQMAVFAIRGLATDVVLGGPDATAVYLSAWDGDADNVILPGEADYYGYSGADYATGNFVYIALDAVRVADGSTISFELSGATTDSLDVPLPSRDDCRLAVVDAEGVPYLVVYYELPALTSGANTLTITLPNGKVYTFDFTV